ncbi:hypothetical protein O5D80_007903 [Batrachochytrium dendrobatidis]|nr:hypothetical protein O5D80_007903 [Batrachochytrium dendrobatidis]
MTFGRGPLVHLDIWTWSLGRGPFGHGPPSSDPPVLGTWPSDTVSSDMVLGHRVFGHHPRTFPTSPSIPLPLDTYLAVRRLFGLGHYLTKSPVTKPVPYHVICNNAHAMPWSDSHIKWGPFQTQLTNHVTMFGLPRLRKRYPIVSFPSGHCHCTKYNNAVHSKRNSPTMLPYYVTILCYHVWLARLWKQYPIVSFPSGHLSSNDNTPLSQSLVQHINPNIVFRIPFSP